MSYLSKLTPDSIKNGVFPLQETLKDSLYYPYSGFYGEVIKNCNTHRKDLEIINFVYCDHRHTLYELGNVMHLFAGYNILGYRDLTKRELVPNGYRLEIPPGLNMRNYPSGYNMPEYFARWIVYERKPNRESVYGPDRFSLLYICTEGIATYQTIYQNNKLFPKAVAIVESNNYMNENWHDISRTNGPFEWSVEHNTNGKPTYILFSSPYNLTVLNWNNYSIINGTYISLWGRNDTKREKISVD